MRGQVRLLIAGLALAASACESSAPDRARAPEGERSPAAAPPRIIGAEQAKGATAPMGDFTVDVSAVDPPCRVGAPCTLRLRLVAKGAYKINADYPMRFVPAATPGVEPAGLGQFELLDPKTGFLDARFRASTPGTVTVTGTYKTAICTDEVCHINDVPVAHTIAIAAATP